MCIKLRKPLNPRAPEWRPSPPPPPPRASALLPHVFYEPHPPPLSASPLVVAVDAAPPTKLLRCTLLSHYAQCPPPVYTISFPAKATEATAPPPICEENTEKLDRRSFEEKGAVVAKRPESPRLDHFKRRPNKFLPPRLRRALRSHTHSRPPPPPPQPKLEWRPKGSVKTDSKVSGAATPPPKSKTTLMIKNIPNQLRRASLLKFLDDQCKFHSLEYDFFYLPFDFRKRGNLGYAFVNLTSSEAAMKMMEVLGNFKWRSKYEGYGEFVYSSKVCEMTWARIQGKEALVTRFQKSSFRCDDVEFLPVVLDPPRDGSDPNPPPPLNLGRLCPPAPAT